MIYLEGEPTYGGAVTISDAVEHSLSINVPNCRIVREEKATATYEPVD